MLNWMPSAVRFSMACGSVNLAAREDGRVAVYLDLSLGRQFCVADVSVYCGERVIGGLHEPPENMIALVGVWRRLLGYGSGWGPLVREIPKRGCEVSGCDASKARWRDGVG